MSYKFNPFTGNLDTVNKNEYTEYVFNSSGTQSKNRYNSWANLVTALASVDGEKRIVFEQSETLPAGTYTLTNVTLVGNGFPPAAGGITITLPTGFVLNEVPILKVDNFLKLKSTSSNPIMTVTGTHNSYLGNNSQLASTTAEFYKTETNSLLVQILFGGCLLINEGYEVINANAADATVALSFIAGANGMTNDVVRGNGVVLVQSFDTGPQANNYDYLGATHANFTGTLLPVVTSRADYVKYDNATSGLTATDVQAAIDELSTGAGGEVYTYQNGPDYATNYVYVGYSAPSGAWYIYRRTYSSDLRQYATGASSYATNWTNRASLTYS